jgi:uncharacterized membrane protein YsdA (DUF1294 family)/cold shock CspA family protein
LPSPANRRERSGQIADWNDARGFGFIETSDVRGRVFFHIKDFDAGHGRPLVGDKVIYELTDGRDGRPAAQRVRVADAILVRTDAPLRVTIRIVGALMLATAIVCCVVAGRTPTWLPLCYLGASFVSFAAYWSDKRRAERGEWRIAEGTLHTIDLAFGIAGGLLAQGILRHKSSKTSFGAMSAVIFALHMGGLLALLAGYGPAEFLAWLSA